MSNNSLFAGLVAVALGLSACNSNTEEQATTEPIEQSIAPETELATQNEKPSAELSISIETIDSMRAAIEGLKIEALEIESSKLRDKVKQKWSKLHFYAQNDVLMKVKTYPHPGISQRTEEFYANENGLLLVVIEDNGEGAKGKAKSELDKMYYFNNGELVKEMNNDKESEFGIRNSDAEELLTEFNEYLEIYKSQGK